MGFAATIIASAFGSKKGRRACGLYAGRDSTSDSESSQEHISKSIPLDRRQRQSLVSGGHYGAEATVPALQADTCTGSCLNASSPTHFEMPNFEDPATPFDRARTVTALARVFEAVLAEEGNANGLACFHSEQVPAITIEAYLARISKYFDCSDAALLTSMIYIDRISKLHPSFPICDRTIHRLLGVSLMVGAKFHDDIFYSNTYYAKVCGVSLKELNRSEREFIQLLSWKCGVAPGEYEEYRSRVIIQVRNDDDYRL